jgi:hypothetical protein
VLFPPARAIGGLFSVFRVRVAGSLAKVPSCTINCTTYEPLMSIGKEVATDVMLVSAAVLPLGLETRLQAYVSVSPSGSDELLPSSATI